MVTNAPSKVAAVLRVVSGNFLEMYDFFIFGIYATAIAKAFFPLVNETAALMLTFATFGAGFLMRPLGALILGGYLDRCGRRQGLLLTLSIMGVGTALIALTPTYSRWGIWAPVVVLLGRLLQGFSAGVELGGVSVYLSEIATPGRKGLYVSWQSASQQVAIVVAASLGFFLNATYNVATMADWGWRIPFLVGCLLIPLIYYLRHSLPETTVFLATQHRPTFKETLNTIRRHCATVALGTMLIMMTTVSFYMITVYAPTFGKTVLTLSMADSLLVTVLVGLSNFIWLPVMGTLSDRVGRWPIMLFFSGLALTTSYPALSWLIAHPSFKSMLVVELWLSCIYGCYNGATVVALTEIIPNQIKTTGFSLAYSLATALFGGFTPLISTWLIDVTGDKAAPGYWLALAGAVGALATTLLYRRPHGDRVVV